MTATLTTPTVEEAVVTTSNYTEEDVNAYFKAYAAYKESQGQTNKARALAESLLDCFVLLGTDRYGRMNSSALYRELTALGVTITVKEDQFSIYHTAGIAMASLAKGDTKAKKVWDAVNKAWKTKGHGLVRCQEIATELAKTRGTWDDFATTVEAECAALTDAIAPALDKLEATDASAWDKGHIARIVALVEKKLGYTVTK